MVGTQTSFSCVKEDHAMLQMKTIPKLNIARVFLDIVHYLKHVERFDWDEDAGNLENTLTKII